MDVNQKSPSDGGLSIGDHLRNEAYAFGHGILDTAGGIGKAVDSIKDHPLETALKVGGSVVAGLALGYLSSRVGWIGMVGRSVGLAAGLSFLYDGAAPIIKTGAMAWNAKNNAQLDLASQYFGSNTAQFLVDTAIQTPGVLAGTRLGVGLKFGFERGTVPTELLSTKAPTEAAATMASTTAPEMASEMQGGAKVADQLAKAVAAAQKTADQTPAAQAVTARKPIVSQPRAIEIVAKQPASSGGDSTPISAPADQALVSHATNASPVPVAERPEVDSAVTRPTDNRTVAQPDNSGENKLSGGPIERRLSSSDQSGLQSYTFQQVVPGASHVPEFDVAMDVSNRQLREGHQTLPWSSRSSQVSQIMRMPEDRLPDSNSVIGVQTVDTDHVVAMAALRNRADNLAIDPELVKLVNASAISGDPDQVELPEWSNARLAYQAVDGVANAPNLSLKAKVGITSDILAGKKSASFLTNWSDRFSLHSQAAQPFHYVQVRPWKPAQFDYGVEITDQDLAQGHPNLDHHGPNATADTPSAAEQALALPDSELPFLGAKVAIEKPDADSLTAVALMANRKDGLPVNERLVEAVGRRDRGFSTDRTGQPYTDVQDSLNSIRSYARDKRMTIPQRITAIREVLAGQADQGRLEQVSSRVQRNQEARVAQLKESATVDIPVPSKLAVVHSPQGLWFDARNYGLQHAPVALVAVDNGGGAHYNVVSAIDNPAGRYMGRALVKFNTLEHGWAGRPNIFVSPHQSVLPEDNVVGLLKYYVDPPMPQRVLWDGEEYLKTPDMYIGMVKGTGSYMTAAGVSQLSRQFAPAAAV